MIRNLLVILVVVLVLGGLFFLLRPDTSATEPRHRTFDVSIEGGEMRPSEISVSQDEHVTLHIESDQPTEFHMHGYDVEREVRPGKAAELEFDADLTGRFEIEDHESERELGVLQVRPR